MTNIIILCGASNERAHRIADLFNDGNRVHVTAILNSPYDLAAPGTDEWLVLDNWNQPLPENIADNYGERIITIAPDRTAPMAATDIITTIRGAQAAYEDPDAAWARTLGVKQDAQEPKPAPAEPTAQPAGKPLPPPIPGTETQQPQPFGYGPAQRQTFVPRQEPVAEPMPANYLVWAILCTVLCCLPAGVVAIIFSTQVSSRYYAGDFDGARRASERAQWWIIISFVLGVLTNTLYLPMAIAGWV